MNVNHYTIRTGHSSTNIIEGLGYSYFIKMRGTGIRVKDRPIIHHCIDIEPAFEATEDFLKTTLFNKGTKNEPYEPKHDPETQENDPNKDHIDLKHDPKTDILTLITENPSITYTELAFSIDKSPATVKRYLQELKASGVVSRIGGRKGGRWSVK